jgi:beta-lactamase regulating signal transducer with metallopeptidase domain
VRYALWLVVLVKLLLPPSLALQTSIAWWVRDTAPAPMAQKRTPLVVTQSQGRKITSPTPVVETTAVEVHEPISPAGWGLMASGCASALLLALMLNQWRQVIHEARTGTEPPAWANELLKDAACATGLRRVVQIRVIDRAVSPAVCGFLRPIILMPRALLEELAPEQLRAILMHELMHLRRGDVWMNGVQALLQVVYWWHPLLWLANARIRRTREEAVDDAVVHSLDRAADTYAPTLLKVARLALQRPMISLGLVGILESRSSLGRRIEKLVSVTPPRKPRLTTVSVVFVVAFGAVALPMGSAPAPQTEEPPPVPAVTNEPVPGSEDAKPTEAVELVQEAKVLFQHKKLNEAESVLRKALQQDPRNRAAEFYITLVQETRLRAAGQPGGIFPGITDTEAIGSVDTGSRTNGGRTVLLSPLQRNGDVPDPEALVTRHFKVDPETFGVNLTEEITSLTNVVKAFREFFDNLGIHIAPPKTLFYTKGERTLLIRATQAEMDIIGAALRAMNSSAAQINLKAKFIAVPETWSWPDGRNFSKVLNGAQTKILLEALESNPEVELVNEASVVTASRRQTQIQMVDLKSVVIGVEPEAMRLPGVITKASDRSHPYLVNQVPFGLSLDFIPYASVDGLKVELTAIASATEFLGYDEPTNQVTVYVDGKTNRVDVPLPRFKSGNMTATASIADGETLFFSNATVEVPEAGKRGGKARQLLVMVTPEIIDAAGNRVNKEHLPQSK